jgi:hypothetical protein
MGVWGVSYVTVCIVNNVIPLTTFFLHAIIKETPQTAQTPPTRSLRPASTTHSHGSNRPPLFLRGPSSARHGATCAP